MLGGASLVFAFGMVAGLMLLRRGWLLTWLFLLLLLLFVTAMMILGIVPPDLLPADPELAVAILVTPPPLAAGLLCGALTVWLLRRMGA